MKKKVLSILLVLCMMLSIVPMATYAAEEPSIFASGDGTSEATAYTIATLEQLEAFRDSVNDGNDYKDQFVKLTADIDMSTKYGEGKGEGGTYASWTPIGVYAVPHTAAKSFKGTFDGDKHVITIYINTTAEEQGLFAYVPKGGTVKNLGIDGEITGGAYVGGVTGFNNGTIEDCYNTGTVNGVSSSIGGVVGNNYDNGTIKKCYNTGAISSKGGIVGGIVGNCHSGTIASCYNNGTVSGGGAISGIAGMGDYCTIINCYNTGAISGTMYIGGVSGNYTGTIENCYNAGTVSGTKKYIGGVVGCYSGTVKNCYNIGTVNGIGDNCTEIGGVIGICEGGTVTNCYYLNTSCSKGSASSSDTVIALTREEFKDQSKFSGFDFTDVWVMSAFLGRPILKAIPEITIKGDGENAETAFEIPDLTTLEAFRDAVNDGNDFNGQFVKVTSDIDMLTKYGSGKGEGGSNLSWTPIGVFTGIMNGKDNEGARPFKGTFDGNGHTIDVYINTVADYQGLFGYVGEGGTVKNLGIGGEITGSNDVGGVVFANVGTIENCYNAATVSGKSDIGGVVGCNDGLVENCYNTGMVSGIGNARYVGGVVGNTFERTIVKNCYNTGSVSGTGYVGGVVGYNQGTITNCYNTGTVSGEDNVGGVVGYNSNGIFIGIVSNCYYLSTSCLTGIGKGTGTATAKSAAEFASGEVAYLLQGTQTEQVWGQTLTGESKDTKPVLTRNINKKVCKVSFLNVDGSAYKALYTNYNGTVTLPTEPTVDSGFKFDGWLADGTEAKFTAATVVTQDIILKAQQVRNVFNVTYKDGKGGTIFTDQSDSITYGESTPVFKGDLTNVASYSFDGWDKTVASTVTKDVVYTAKWKNKAANKLILNGNGGTVGTSSTTESTTDEKSLAIGENTFAMAGYHFVAWNTLANGKGTAYNSGDSVDFTAIHNAETVTLYAQWEVNSDYEISFNRGAELGLSRKGNVKWTDKVLDGVTAPTNNGYSFDGWVCNGKNVTDKTTYGELAGKDTVKAITVKAQWSVKNSYKVTYRNPMAGVAVNSHVKWTDKLLDGMTEPKQDGYHFDGWFCDGKKVMASTTYAELAVKDTVMSLELVAKWTDIENPVISGIENGKTYCSAQTVTVTDNGTIKSITVNGNGIQLDNDGKFTLNPAEGEQVIVVTDSDGNTATMKATVNDGHTGGTATCTEQAECAVCGTPYGALKPHSYSKSWNHDETAHWHECVCGDKADYAEHTFEWVTDKEATTSETGEAHEECTVCHATRNEHTVTDKLPTAWDNFVNWLVSIIARMLEWVFDLISSVC